MTGTKTVTLVNLIPYPTMASGWTGNTSTEQKYTGTVSRKLVGTTSTPEVTINTTAAIPLNPSHIYYARVYGYQPTKCGTVGFYWPIAEPSFKEGIPVGDAGRWILYSAQNSRTSFSSGSYQFRLDFNNNYTAGTTYFDGCMLIDLTAAFGAGNEPDKEWCDRSIRFFEGSLSLSIYSLDVFAITGASFSVNPANINQKTVLRVNIDEGTEYSAPPLYMAGEFYSGEV